MVPRFCSSPQSASRSFRPGKKIIKKACCTIRTETICRPYFPTKAKTCPVRKLKYLAQKRNTTLDNNAFLFAVLSILWNTEYCLFRQHPFCQRDLCHRRSRFLYLCKCYLTSYSCVHEERWKITLHTHTHTCTHIYSIPVIRSIPLCLFCPHSWSLHFSSELFILSICTSMASVRATSQVS